MTSYFAMLHHPYSPFLSYQTYYTPPQVPKNGLIGSRLSVRLFLYGMAGFRPHVTPISLMINSFPRSRYVFSLPQ